MSTTTVGTFRTRLRFRVQKKLNIEANEHRLVVAGREVVLAAPTPETFICDSEWLVMNARGFLSDADARNFGHNLRSAIELSSVSTRLGVDAGRDVATSGLGPAVRDRIAATSGELVRDNIHGVDVFADDPRVRFISFNVSGTVRASPDAFLALAVELHERGTQLAGETKDTILLMNFALMRPEPVAQIVFAFSAVEMLGQQEVWTSTQRTLLVELAGSAGTSTLGTEQERKEVADAIRRGTHRLSLRQGVFRLLDRLDLAALKSDWDRLYAERSSLVHGLAPRPGADYANLAQRAVSLCGRILLTAISVELPSARKHLGTYYPTLTQQD